MDSYSYCRTSLIFSQHEWITFALHLICLDAALITANNGTYFKEYIKRWQLISESSADLYPTLSWFSMCCLVEADEPTNKEIAVATTMSDSLLPR